MFKHSWLIERISPLIVTSLYPAWEHASDHPSAPAITNPSRHHYPWQLCLPHLHSEAIPDGHPRAILILLTSATRGSQTQSQQGFNEWPRRLQALFSCFSNHEKKVSTFSIDRFLSMSVDCLSVCLSVYLCLCFGRDMRCVCMSACLCVVWTRTLCFWSVLSVFVLFFLLKLTVITVALSVLSCLARVKGSLLLFTPTHWQKSHPGNLGLRSWKDAKYTLVFHQEPRAHLDEKAHWRIWYHEKSYLEALPDDAPHSPAVVQVWGIAMHVCLLFVMLQVKKKKKK